MPSTSTARISAEPMRTGRSIRARTPGLRRTSMPIATGTSTIANTWTHLGERQRHLVAAVVVVDRQSVTSGRVNSAITELIAVSVMFSATSPRNRWLNRLALVPPGEAASSSMPMPSSGGRSKQHDEAEADRRQQEELAPQRDRHSARVVCRPGGSRRGEVEPEAEHDDGQGDRQTDSGERGVHDRTLVTRGPPVWVIDARAGGGLEPPLRGQDLNLVSASSATGRGRQSR